MGFLITQSNLNKTASVAVRLAFQILTTTLLSLLLPLSFLLLARLSTAHYLLSVTHNYPIPDSPSFACSLFLYTKKPTILHLLISIISVAALSQGLTGNITFLTRLPEPLTRTRLFAAWIFLCVLQICVCLGIEGSIASGIDGSGFGDERSLFCRMVFFFGLHETTISWWRTVVKPVVDDTIFGYSKGESWVEKAAMGLSYGGLWWWQLRGELEALAVVPEVKRERMMGIGVADFVGWWLYYLTVTIGMVRMVRDLILTVVIMTRRRMDVERLLNDEKV